MPIFKKQGKSTTFITEKNHGELLIKPQYFTQIATLPTEVIGIIFIFAGLTYYDTWQLLERKAISKEEEISLKSDALWKHFFQDCFPLKKQASENEPYYDAFKRHYQALLEDIRKFDDGFVSIPTGFKNDRNVLRIAVSKGGWALINASETLRNDPELVLIAVKKHGRALVMASQTLRKNRKIVLAAVKKDGLALQYVSTPLKDNRVIVFAAVKQTCWALKHASSRLKNDLEIVATAIKKDCQALRYASQLLQKHPQLQRLASISEHDVRAQACDNYLKKLAKKTSNRRKSSSCFRFFNAFFNQKETPQTNALLPLKQG